MQISLVQNFSSNWQYLFFGSNSLKKGFLVKNWKSSLNCSKKKSSKFKHWIAYIQISLLIPNFCFNWQFWFFFWPDLSKSAVFGITQKKWTPHIFYINLHIQISQVWNLSSNWQFRFFGQNLPKTDNFDFFWLDLFQKSFFGPKQKKWTPHIFYIFCIFKLI